MQFNYEEPEEIKVYKGGRIIEPGAYIGKFERVYETENKSKGSVNIVFEFISNQGEKLTWNENAIYTKNGEIVQNVIFRDRIEKQIIPLLGLKSLSSKPNDMLTFWDYDIKAEVDKKVTSYPQLFEKNIGVFLKRTTSSWVTDSGEKKTSVKLVPDFFFDPITKQTSEEKVNNKPANTIVLKLEAINSSTKRDEKHIEKKAETQQPTKTYSSADKKSIGFDGEFDDFDEDIPF